MWTRRLIMETRHIRVVCPYINHQLLTRIEKLLRSTLLIPYYRNNYRQESKYANNINVFINLVKLFSKIFYKRNDNELRENLQTKFLLFWNIRS